MNKDSRIYVAGHKKIAGPAILRRLKDLEYSQIINEIAESPDFSDFQKVNRFFSEFRPEYVFISSGPPGGILANLKYPVEFSRENLLAAANLLEAAHIHKVQKLLYLGTSCMYPRDSVQPLKPEYLMKGPMESTSRAHSSARLACVELCRAYRGQYSDPFYAVIPSDTFGREDYFDRENSHVISALIVKIHEAKMRGESSVELLGSGRTIRDFIFSQDLADACIFLMNEWNGEEIVNVSAHQPYSIKDIAAVICEVVGFQGKICFDLKSPDGTPEKRLDASPLFELGWKPTVELREALRLSYEGYLRKLLISANL